MAYRFDGSTSKLFFSAAPLASYADGPITLAIYLKRNALAGFRDLVGVFDSTSAVRVATYTNTSDQLVAARNVNGTNGQLTNNTTLWYLLVTTFSSGGVCRYHRNDGTSWTHTGGATHPDVAIAASGDRIGISSNIAAGFLAGDVVCAGIKKTDSTDLQIETLGLFDFTSWQAYGFDWLARFDNIATRTNLANPGTGDEVSRVGITLVADPVGFGTPAFIPQIIWFTPAASAGVAPAAPTYESQIAYASVANRPAVTGTTRPFASSAALTGALNAAVPGDLVQYTGAGILDIPGNYVGLAGRRYAGYVNIDLGLPASANHVRFTGGGGAGLPAVGIYNSQYLRIYGGEITNPPPKTVGHDGLHIYGAGHAGDGSTNHIVWWNLVVHDTVDSGIKLLPNVPFGGSGQTALDNTIADCDIEATVSMIGRDKTVDTHPEQGTGQHCCLLADTSPSGATYPSFLRNRVAIDGYNTGLSSGQGGGSIVEIGFPDAASTISGTTLIIRGNNTLFNAQQQTAGNGLNVWGDAAINATVQYLQHANATGSPVSNYPPGQNRSGVVVVYGRHTSTNQNAYEGAVPWQIGPTYRDVA